MLARSRLVTVVGAGGVGKTQLALEVARRMAPSFADGAAFVSLADLDDPALVTSEIARNLDFVDVSGPEPAEGLNAALRSLRMLLVVDNFEHLVAAGPVLAAVTAGCPAITLLVTSRRRLGVAVERIFELGPLAVPGEEDTDALAEVASVALFCERAAAVNPSFHPEGPDLQAVSALCRLVDGLPLAIELIASHVRLLRAEALLARMQDPQHGLEFVRGGAIDVEPRHRDLRHTIAWSADLLSAAAARLLPRLSVFREGWTLEAMEDVCCSDLVAAVAFDALVELVDLHLVEPVRVAGDEARFRLLETVRRYASDDLADNGEAGVLGDRHADHFAAFAAQAGAGLQSKAVHRWIARVDRELPNVRAALQHLVASGRADEGLAVAAGLGPYWLGHGPIGEGREWIDELLQSGTGPLRVRAIAQGWTARLALEQGEIGASAEADERDQRLGRARDLLDREADLTEWLRLTEHLSTSLHLQGRFAEVDALLVEALEFGPTPATAWIRVELQHLHAVNAQDSEARDPDDIARLFKDTIAAARLVAHDVVRAQAFGRLMMARPPPRSALADARTELEEAFGVIQQLGDWRNAAHTAIGAGSLALAVRDDAAAASWFGRALDNSVAIGYWHGVVWTVIGVTRVAARAGRLVDAARFHGALRDSLEQVNRLMPSVQVAAYHRLVQRLREGLGDDFEAECWAGEERDWPGTITAARRLLADVARDEDVTTKRPRRRRGPRANPELTEREVDVLRALVAGHTNQQVAATLGISASTVMHHTMSVYRKLAVRGRAEAVAHALRTGLVT